MLRPVFLSVCISCLTTGSLCAQEVRPDAVWQPKPAEWQSVRTQCQGGPASDYSSCLLLKLQGAAPPAAASFIKWLNAHTNNVGWLTAFHKTPGTIGIASVMFPLRANDNAEWLIVNGQPAVIDVDDLQSLPTADMERSADYQSLKKAHPDVSLFAGDRSGPAGPQIQKMANGQLRLIVGYPLLEGCHACAVLGTARFGFDFSADAHFIGSHFLSVGASRSNKRSMRSRVVR